MVPAGLQPHGPRRDGNAPNLRGILCVTFPGQTLGQPGQLFRFLLLDLPACIPELVGAAEPAGGGGSCIQRSKLIIQVMGAIGTTP